MYKICVIWLVGNVIMVSPIMGAPANPGFDETPWDTFWTIQCDTSRRGYSTDAAAIVRSDSGISPPNCCYLRAVISARTGPSRGGGAQADAQSTISQRFDGVAGCVVKVRVKYRVEASTGGNSGSTARCVVKLLLDTEWDSVWEIECRSGSGSICRRDTNVWVEVCTTIAECQVLSGVEFSVLSSGQVQGRYYFAGASAEFWVDDISITEAGVEGESDLETGNVRLEVRPNPCVESADICFQLPVRGNAMLTVHDISGRTVSEFCVEHPARRIAWNAVSSEEGHLTSGLYFAKLETDCGEVKIVKFIFLCRKDTR